MEFRILGPLELPDQLVVAPEDEVGVDPELDRCQPDLLELVDSQQEASVGRQRVESLDKRILRSRHEHTAKLVQRPLAGTQQPPPPAPAARQDSSGEGREQTGAEDRRLAAARRADDAEEAGADRRATSSATSRSRPK
jgi:hypothetical protein